MFVKLYVLTLFCQRADIWALIWAIQTFLGLLNITGYNTKILLVLVLYHCFTRNFPYKLLPFYVINTHYFQVQSAQYMSKILYKSCMYNLLYRSTHIYSLYYHLTRSICQFMQNL